MLWAVWNKSATARKTLKSRYKSFRFVRNVKSDTCTHTGKDTQDTQVKSTCTKTHAHTHTHQS